MKKSILYIFAAICLLSNFFGGCANSSRSPEGGPKDTIPPTLMAQAPLYKTTEFKGNELRFTFDEYVQLKDQNTQFTMSPPTEKRPTLKVRGKQVIVSFPEPLKDSTTYFIDFGSSVVDLNESNPLQNMSTVFSTGQNIDSLVYIGRLEDAFSLEPVESISIFLYDENTDSIPYLKTPNALTRTDKDGVFIIKGLKNISYKIVAVDDKNSNHKYDPANEQIAFNPNVIQPLQIGESDSLSYESLPVLRLFTENVRKQFLNSYKQPEKRQIELIFNQINPEITSFDVNGLTKDDFIIERSRWNDTLRYWIKSKNVPDSLRATINYLSTDSINQLSPTELKLKFELEKKTDNQQNKKKKKDDEEEKTPVITPNITASLRSIIESNVRLGFSTPLINLNTKQITLFKFNDEGDKKEPVNFEFIQDTLKIREYMLKAKWETASKYELQIQPNAFTDIYGIHNDTIIKAFETANPDNYSSITVSLNNAQGSYIIQLMKDKSVVGEKYINGNNKATFAYLDAAKYRIRVIEDKNSNKIWDAGLYLSKLQPERVGFVKFSDNNNVLELRANWDVEQTVDINLIFTDK